MKKPFYIQFFLILFLAFSCGQNSAEKNLNGKWYEITNEGITRLYFKPDSLIITDLDNQIMEWSADNSNIEFDYNLMLLDSMGRNIKKTTLEYNLSATNDTLYTKITASQKKIQFNLIRANSYIDYLNKRSGIQFELPKDDKSEYIKLDSEYALKIFMGFSENKMIGKTELSSSLNNLESDIKKIKDKLITGRPENDLLTDLKFHLRVFADKKIPDSVITKSLTTTIKSDIFRIYDLPKPPNDTVPIKIYRIYQSEEKERLDNLKGKKIKTIANTVYNSLLPIFLTENPRNFIILVS